MAWDAKRDQASFKTWRSASVNPRWERNGEYQRARAAVGLA
jgi:hypothetical protein